MIGNGFVLVQRLKLTGIGPAQDWCFIAVRKPHTPGNQTWDLPLGTDIWWSSLETYSNRPNCEISVVVMIEIGEAVEAWCEGLEGGEVQRGVCNSINCNLLQNVI